MTEFSQAYFASSALALAVKKCNIIIAIYVAKQVKSCEGLHSNPFLTG